MYKDNYWNLLVTSQPSCHMWMCLSNHQEYAAPAIPVCSRSGLCDRETSSSHCPSTHLSKLIRSTIVNKSGSSREDECVHFSVCVSVTVCFEGYRINIATQVCCSLFSSGTRSPPELAASPSNRLHWMSSPVKPHMKNCLQCKYFTILNE